MHALHTIMGCANDYKISLQTIGQRDRELERRTYKLNWTPLGSFGPQCGDKRIKTLDPRNGNEYKDKIEKRPTYDRIDRRKNLLYC